MKTQLFFGLSLILTTMHAQAEPVQNIFICQSTRDTVGVIVQHTVGGGAYALNIRDGKSSTIRYNSNDQLPNGNFYKVFTGNVYYSALPVEVLVELETDESGDQVFELAFEIRDSGLEFDCTRDYQTE